MMIYVIDNTRTRAKISAIINRAEQGSLCMNNVPGLLSSIHVKPSVLVCMQDHAMNAGWMLHADR